MVDLRSIPVARLLLPFAAGGYLGYRPEGNIPVAGILVLSLLLWIAAALFFHFSGKGARWPALCFSSVGILLIIITGFGSGRASWKVDPRLPTGIKVVVQGRLRSSPVDQGEFHCFEFQALMVRDSTGPRKINSILKVYYRPGADTIIPVAGETRILYGNAYPVKNSGNPGDPDYETIMHRQNIWYRFYGSPPPVRAYPDSSCSSFKPGSILGSQTARRLPSAFRIRNRLTGQWKGGAEETGLLQAVCLGERSGLTDDIRESYSQAGGMHLLAVSGLHVGLIWWVLRHLFSWMLIIPAGAFFRSFSVVLILWFYAFITGFAPPVCRSVIMFTMITGSRMLDHRTHPVNAILISAFLLLVADPGWITRVGFQLSYAAILGIVLLYGPVVRLICPSNRVIGYFWQATALSFSAQLATAPLVIFYFHQFPIYSLITSMVSVPMLSCLIALFVLSVPFAVSGRIPGILNWILMEMAGWMNRFMELMASIPGSVAGDLFIDPISLFCLMALAAFMISAVSNYRPYKLNALLLILVVLSFRSAVKEYMMYHSSEIQVAHFNGGSLVTFREGKRADHYLFSGDSVTATRIHAYLDRTWMRVRMQNQVLGIFDANQVEGHVSCYRQLARGLSLLGNDSLSGLVISGSGIAFDGALPCVRAPDFILLCNGAGNPGLLQELPTDTRIIIDGSNGRTNAVAPRISDIYVHRTDLDGAFLMRW